MENTLDLGVGGIAGEADEANEGSERKEEATKTITSVLQQARDEYEETEEVAHASTRKWTARKSEAKAKQQRPDTSSYDQTQSSFSFEQRLQDWVSDFNKSTPTSSAKSKRAALVTRKKKKKPASETTDDVLEDESENVTEWSADDDVEDKSENASDEADDDDIEEDFEDTNDEAADDNIEEEPEPDGDSFSSTADISDDLVLTEHERQERDERLAKQREQDKKHAADAELRTGHAYHCLKRTAALNKTMSIGPLQQGQWILHSTEYLDLYYREGIQTTMNFLPAGIPLKPEDYWSKPGYRWCQLRIGPLSFSVFIPCDRPMYASLEPVILETCPGEVKFEVTFLGKGYLKMRVRADALLGRSVKDGERMIEFAGVFESDEVRRRVWGGKGSP